jgi:hypothetical protein
MEKLNQLKNKCKGSVSLGLNPHKDYYESVEDYIPKGDIEDIPKDVLKEIVNTNTLVVLQFYLDSPVGSYTVYHYDIETAVEIALKLSYE